MNITRMRRREDAVAVETANKRTPSEGISLQTVVEMGRSEEENKEVVTTTEGSDEGEEI